MHPMIRFSLTLVSVHGLVETPQELGIAERAVRALLDRQVEAWNRGDLDGFLETYWNSPQLVFQSGGDRTRGFDATRDRYTKRYKSEGQAMGTLTFSEIEIESLAADAVLVLGRWQLALPNGTKPRGLFTLIVRRLPEGWRITDDHTSSATTE